MNNGSGLNWNTLTQLAQNRMMQMNQPMYALKQAQIMFNQMYGGNKR